jgi:hypothetical protein
LLHICCSLHNSIVSLDLSSIFNLIYFTLAFVTCLTYNINNFFERKCF